MMKTGKAPSEHESSSGIQFLPNQYRSNYKKNVSFAIKCQVDCSEEFLQDIFSFLGKNMILVASSFVAQNWRQNYRYFR